MPCPHRSLDDLQLQYVDWEVKTLFVGTFNPAWKSCGNNYSKWFYGRTARNNFWCILPTIHEQIPMLNGNRAAWIDFCRQNHLGITDIIRSLDDANEASEIHRDAVCNFKDDELAKFQVTLNDIPAILEAHPNIKQICITRQTLPRFWKQCFKATFQWVSQHPERNIAIRQLRSPSRVAINGVVGNHCEFAANQWLEQGYQILHP